MNLYLNYVLSVSVLYSMCTSLVASNSDNLQVNNNINTHLETSFHPQQKTVKLPSQAANFMATCLLLTYQNVCLRGSKRKSMNLLNLSLNGATYSFTMKPTMNE